MLNYKNRWMPDELGRANTLWILGESIERIAALIGRSPCAVAYKLLNSIHAEAYRTLWAMKKQGGK